MAKNVRLQVSRAVAVLVLLGTGLLLTASARLTSFPPLPPVEPPAQSYSQPTTRRLDPPSFREPDHTRSPQPPEVWEELRVPGAGALPGIAAVAEDDIWVIGQRADDYAGLVAHWDGKGWQHYRPEEGSLARYNLTNITARTSNDIWIVGYHDGPGVSDRSVPEALHWDGSAWTHMPTPEQTARVMMLKAAAAVASDDVWAISNAFDRPDQQMGAIVHWDGKRWESSFSVPHGRFEQIAAVSAGDIWAVDGDANGALYLHWDGTKWTRHQLPKTGQGVNGGPFSNSAAPDRNNVWFVGSSVYVGAYDHIRTHATHWDGQAWGTVLSSYSRIPGEEEYLILFSIEGTSGDGIWAAGAVGGEHLFMRWNGSGWETMSCPGHRSSGLYVGITDIALLPTGEILAVGGDGLFLRYLPGSCPSATSSLRRAPGTAK